MKRIFLALAALLIGFAGTARAEEFLCDAGDLLAGLSPAERAALSAATEAARNGRGRYWQIEKDGKVSWLFGTVHFDGPGIDFPTSLPERARTARGLWLEVNAADEAAFQQRLATTPTMLFNPDGPDLTEHFDEEEWALISNALAESGVPPVLALRMKPWFLNISLMVPPCAARMLAAGHKGLDRQLEDIALAAGVPVHSLESPEAVLELFGRDSFEDQIGMIRVSLPSLEQRDAMTGATLELYRDDRPVEVWELSRIIAEREMDKAEVERELRRFWNLLVAQRNETWLETVIPEMEQGNVVVAVGALHLPTEDGLVAHLERAGFTVTRLTD